MTEDPTVPAAEPHDPLAAFKAAVSTLNKDQLREGNKIILARFKEIETELAREAIAKFSVGDIVEFDQRGRAIQIVVQSIHEKIIVGLTNDAIKTKWRVHPSLCRHAAVEEKAAPVAEESVHAEPAGPVVPGVAEHDWSEMDRRLAPEPAPAVETMDGFGEF